VQGVGCRLRGAGCRFLPLCTSSTPSRRERLDVETAGRERLHPGRVSSAQFCPAVLGGQALLGARRYQAQGAAGGRALLGGLRSFPRCMSLTPSRREVLDVEFDEKCWTLRRFSSRSSLPAMRAGSPRGPSFCFFFFDALEPRVA